MRHALYTQVIMERHEALLASLSERLSPEERRMFEQTIAGMSEEEQIAAMMAEASSSEVADPKLPPPPPPRVLEPLQVQVLVGPVVGQVTMTSAVLMLETDLSAGVTCVVEDESTDKVVQVVSRVMTAGSPVAFKVSRLMPGQRYRARFESGVLSWQAKTQTLVDKGERLVTFVSPPMTATFRAASSSSIPRCLYVHHLALTGAANEATSHDSGILEQLWNREIQNNKTDVVWHLGGCVDLSGAIKQAAVLLCRRGAMDGRSMLPHEEAALLVRVRTVLADAFRHQWTSGLVRKVLAHGSHMMGMGGLSNHIERSLAAAFPSPPPLRQPTGSARMRPHHTVVAALDRFAKARRDLRRLVQEVVAAYCGSLLSVTGQGEDAVDASSTKKTKKKRRKKRDKPWTSPLVGSRVRVTFDSGKYYYGSISAYDHTHHEIQYFEKLRQDISVLKPYHIAYDDGTEEWVAVSDPTVLVLSPDVAAQKMQSRARVVRAKQTSKLRRRHPDGTAVPTPRILTPEELATRTSLPIRYQTYDEAVARIQLMVRSRQLKLRLRAEKRVRDADRVTGAKATRAITRLQAIKRGNDYRAKVLEQKKLVATVFLQTVRRQVNARRYVERQFGYAANKDLLHLMKTEDENNVTGDGRYVIEAAAIRLDKQLSRVSETFVKKLRGGPAVEMADDGAGGAGAMYTSLSGSELIIHNELSASLMLVFKRERVSAADMAMDETQRSSQQWKNLVTALQVSIRRMKKLTRLAVCSEAPLILTKQQQLVANTVPQWGASLLLAWLMKWKTQTADNLAREVVVLCGGMKGQ